MQRSLFLTVLFLTGLLAACAIGLPGPPVSDLGPGTEGAIFFLLAVAVAFWIGRNGLSRYWPKSSENHSKAYELLRERYAKGEMSREDYLRATADLGAHESSRQA
jgi:uncharacterized membrane protein YccC